MDNLIFNEYKINTKAYNEIISKYKDKIPEELMNIWIKYGFGTILNGYLKIINPDEYLKIIEQSYFRVNISIPVMVTGFGDIITWEENKYIRIIKYKSGSFKGIASGFDFFWDDINTEYFCNEFFELNKYNEAIEFHGHLEFDQCFGYVPLLGLGGSEKVENLKKVKIREHIELITQLVGPIE